VDAVKAIRCGLYGVAGAYGEGLVGVPLLLTIVSISVTYTFESRLMTDAASEAFPGARASAVPAGGLAIRALPLVLFQLTD
jgi:hypothetical protein